MATLHTEQSVTPVSVTECNAYVAGIDTVQETLTKASVLQV